MNSRYKPITNKSEVVIGVYIKRKLKRNINCFIPVFNYTENPNETYYTYLGAGSTSIGENNECEEYIRECNIN